MTPETSDGAPKPFCVLTFNVIPKSKPRPKFAVRGHGKKQFVQTYTPPEYQKYEDELKEGARLQLMAHGTKPSGRDMVFLSRFYVADKRKRDLDNMCKTFDAFHDIIFFNDDQIQSHFSHKEFDKSRPRIEVEVYFYEDFIAHKEAIMLQWLKTTYPTSP